MVLDRTHRARHDLDWLPPSFKALRWTVAGGLWTALGGSLVASGIFLKPGFFIYGKGIAFLFAGGYYAGDRAAKAVLRSRLAKLARGQVDLTRLQRATDGELVHVRGKVKAEKTLRGVLHEDRPAVYRRVVFSIGNERWVHEAAEDFRIVDETGEAAMVQVAGARLIAPEPKRVRVEDDTARAVLALTVDQDVRSRAELRVGRRERGAITASEVLVQDGDELELVGYKSRTVDPTVTERLARETPLRATLRSGRELPLLLAPVRS